MRPRSLTARVWLPLGATIAASGCAAVLDFDIGEEAGGPSTTVGPGTSSSSGGTGAGNPTGTGQAGPTGTGAGDPAGTGAGDPSGTGGSSGTEGGAGAGASSTGTSPDPCAGCRDEEGRCVAGDDPRACGASGEACTVCESSGECQLATCNEGSCGEVGLGDGEPCVGGECKDGECRESAENCTNGIDDDGLNGADCFDPLCAGLASCLPDVPDGWNGPYAVYFGNAPVTCPSVWPTPIGEPLERVLIEGAVTCPSCACDTTCTMQVEYASASFCGGGFPFSVDVSSDPGTCVLVPGGQTEKTVTPVGTQMGCAPLSTGTPSIEPPTLEVLTLCGGPSGVCSQGECFSTIPDQPSTSERACIVAPGVLACPTPAYASWSLGFAEISDERSCSGCECGLGDCGGYLTLYEGADCRQCAGNCSAHSVGSCEAFPGGNVHMAYTPDEGCEVVPSVQVGSVTETGAWSICCLP